ncbi:hypothetical protein AYO20_05226 [Fonsecaea nubica]|uniref:Uncharacterized protein n=1 Tax=Fonsecaea nubica TaxID=856822 RepID=A0A178D1S2_9EURO|nr:hypothetical protein AYO20_05226 [Fonsecaea nubica]OAL35607.1 hypothetical protein AYO20_05226 [Fonsecaea nubica]
MGRIASSSDRLDMYLANVRRSIYVGKGGQEGTEASLAQTRVEGPSNDLDAFLPNLNHGDDDSGGSAVPRPSQILTEATTCAHATLPNETAAPMMVPFSLIAPSEGTGPALGVPAFVRVFMPHFPSSMQ